MMNPLVELPFLITSFATVAMMFVAMIGIAKLGDEVFGCNSAFLKLKVFFRNSIGVQTFSRGYVASLFVMDSLYGYRIFSLRALATSMLTSCLWISILVGATVLSQGRQSWIFHKVFEPHVVHYFWGFLIVGLIVDFLALSVARIVLRMLPGKRSVSVLGALVGAMAVIALIFYVLYGLSKFVFIGQPITSLPLNQITEWATRPGELNLTFKTLNDWHLIQTAPSVFKIRDGNSEIVYAFPEGLLFLSSQLALVWLGLHAISHWLYFGGYRVSRWARWLVAEAAFDSRPLQSSATVTALFAILPTWCIVLAWYYSPRLWI